MSEENINTVSVVDQRCDRCGDKLKSTVIYINAERLCVSCWMKKNCITVQCPHCGNIVGVKND